MDAVTQLVEASGRMGRCSLLVGAVVFATGVGLLVVSRSRKVFVAYLVLAAMPFAAGVIGKLTGAGTVQVNATSAVDLFTPQNLTYRPYWFTSVAVVVGTLGSIPSLVVGAVGVVLSGTSKRAAPGRDGG